MKRIPATLLWASSLLLLLSAASCTDTLVGRPDTDDRTITFQTPQADTRAVVTGTSLTSGSFLVWGGYGGNATNVFDAVTVTGENGVWTYEGTRYWKAGETYNFYAVYPAELPAGAVADVSPEGTVTVTGFNCSATGDAAVDLMTANTDITYYVGDTPQPVTMRFDHLLSKVNIVATVKGGNCTVTSVTFSGMATKGSYNSTDGWSDTTPGYFTSSERVLNTTGVDLLGDLLLIPQRVTEEFKIKVSYTLDGVQMYKDITLPTSIDQWKAGQSYKYTLTFKGNNIIFTVNVASWGHSTGGIITVE